MQAHGGGHLERSFSPTRMGGFPPDAYSALRNASRDRKRAGFLAGEMAAAGIALATGKIPRRGKTSTNGVRGTLLGYQRGSFMPFRPGFHSKSGLDKCFRAWYSLCS